MNKLITVSRTEDGGFVIQFDTTAYYQRGEPIRATESSLESHEKVIIELAEYVWEKQV